MDNFNLDQAIGHGFTLAKRGEYQELADLSHSILGHRPDDFMGTYFLGLAEIGRGNQTLGHRLLEKAEAIFPRIRDYGFIASYMRRRGYAEIDILFQRLWLLAVFRATDSFLLSYPKCGRTWLRFMLGHYALHGQEGDPLEVTAISRKDPKLSVLEVFHDDEPHLKPVAEIIDEKEAYRGKRVVFLSRDPRDVIVSYFFQYTLRGDKRLANDEDFSGDLGAFIRKDIGGLKSVVRFYNVWATNRQVPAAFMNVSYEALSLDARPALKSVIDFLGWPDFGAGNIERAVAAGSFENMRQLESEDTLGNPILRPAEDDNPEAFKVRRGMVGGYRDYLSPEDINWVDEYLIGELDDFFADYKYVS